MILRCVSWSIFLCFALRATVNAQVHITEKGYQNVLISFSPNVPSENGQELIKNVTELLEATSNALHTAIGIRIATATFLLPPSWSTETWEGFSITPATLEQAESKPDIQVDATAETPFGKQPVALQHGGCGVPGHQIILPLEFLSSTESYPKDKLLAREWLKHRYGVFEENGFKHDELYPDYYRIPGSSDIKITQCTNREVKYKFKRPDDGEECIVMDTVEFGYCRLHPDEETGGNVTSSLMYFHQELQNMEHICGKDDHPHHNTTLSKQNILCDGQSIWDVINLSSDFKIAQQEPTDEVPESIQFSYVQSSQPRFIVLLEDSDNLFEMKSAVKFALKRFYYDLPPKSKLAIYAFSDAVEETLTYRELTEQERSDLGPIADFINPPDNICTSCGLVKAMETFLTNDELRKGSILLITASSLDKVPELSENLKVAGISLNVLRFADAEAPVPIDNTYEPLRDSFSSFTYMQISNSLEEVESFKNLYSFMKKYEPEPNDFSTRTVVSEMMSSVKTVTIPEDATASLYTLWVNSTFTSSGSIKCKAGDADVTLTAGVKGTDVSSYTFPHREEEVICSLSSSRLNPILTQVQMTTQKGYYFDFDTWIHDPSTDTEQKPIIIYAKIYFGGYPVKDASVTATVIRENKPEEDIANTSNNAEEGIVVKMLDNGRGDPDITRNDGVYSGYFAGFETEGKYQITIKMSDNGGKAKIGKEYPELMSATCCGSKVFTQDGDVPSFQTESVTEYHAKNKMPEDGYPPSRIVDLRMELFNSSSFALLTWTAPGAGKAGRYEIKLFQNRENAVKNFDTTGNAQNVSGVVPAESGEMEGFLVYFSNLVVDSTYYVTMRSWSEANKSSKISNVVEFFLPKDGEGTTMTNDFTTTKNIEDDDSVKRAQARRRTIEIVVGVLAGIVVLCILVYLGVYFFVQRPKRKEAKLKARKKAENGGGSRTSGGQSGLNSIPADVIIRHHNEVLEAKNQHKDPPIFKEENLNSSQSSPELPENSRRNNNISQYAMVQKNPEATAPNSSQQDPSKSPKRMTVV